MNELDDISDLEQVVGPLRSPAKPAELVQETAMLELMVNAHRTAGGKHMFTSRRAKVATLVVAGVLGFGGMAAATPSLIGDQPTEQDPVLVVEPVVDETLEPIDPVEPVEPVDPIQPETSGEVEVEVTPAEPGPDSVEEVEPVVPAEPAQEAPAEAAPGEVAPGEVVLVDDPATAFDETWCLPGNHGATVSAVARGEFPGDVSVADAAQSSCGKTVEVEVDAPAIDAEIEIESEPSSERPERDTGAASNGKANQNSNGKANENSNGKANENSNGKASQNSNAPGKRGG